MKAILNYCEEHSLNFDVSYDAGVFTMIFYSIEDEFREEIKIPTPINSGSLKLDFDIVSKLSTAFSMHTVEKMDAKKVVENDDDISANISEGNRLYFQKGDLRLGNILPFINPLIRMNNILVIDTSNGNSLSLINKEHYNSTVFSDRFLNAEVVYIQNDECIPDTIVIGMLFDEEE